MRNIADALTVLFVFAGISAAPAAEMQIGTVVRCQGLCADVSAGAPESLTGGEAVRLNEKLSTGADGRLELAFDDGTHMTLGERAEVVIDAFVYRPAGTSRFHAAIAGSFRYVSGMLAAGASRTASVTTPVALIGVRGTDFWGGTVNNVSGVVVFAGSVSVTTAVGTVVLSAPGEGTDLSTPGVPPGAVTQWSRDRIAAAIASVSFH